METAFKKVLSEDEVLAIEILEKSGWQFMSEITVEKCTPVGERWPLYTSGGEFPMGVLRDKEALKVKPPGSKKKGSKKE
jgi:hypothetical protein